MPDPALVEGVPECAVGQGQDWRMVGTVMPQKDDPLPGGHRSILFDNTTAARSDTVRLATVKLARGRHPDADVDMGKSR